MSNKLYISRENEIFAVIYQLEQLKKGPGRKKFRLQRDSNPWPLRFRYKRSTTELWSHWDLQLPFFFSGLLFNCSSWYITAKISFSLVLSTAVHIYELFHIFIIAKLYISYLLNTYANYCCWVASAQSLLSGHQLLMAKLIVTGASKRLDTITYCISSNKRALI